MRQKVILQLIFFYHKNGVKTERKVYFLLEFHECFLRSTVSIRDILSWVNFINICCQVKDSSNTPSPMEVDEDSTTKLGQTGLPPAVAFVHGACLVFIDSLGAGLYCT